MHLKGGRALRAHVFLPLSAGLSQPPSSGEAPPLTAVLIPAFLEPATPALPARAGPLRSLAAACPVPASQTAHLCSSLLKLLPAAAPPSPQLTSQQWPPLGPGALGPSVLVRGPLGAAALGPAALEPEAVLGRPIPPLPRRRLPSSWPGIQSD